MISTMDSPASVRALDLAAAEQDEFAAQEAFAASEIREAFAQLGKMPAKLIAVPYEAGDHVRWMPMNLVVEDLIGDGWGIPELVAALESSACPHVAALRSALCEKWVEQKAADIAEARL